MISEDSSKDYTFFYEHEMINKVVNLYIGGMAIDDIAVYVEMDTAAVNQLLDSVIPHL
jgi:hypothetical protein